MNKLLIGILFIIIGLLLVSCETPLRPWDPIQEIEEISTASITGGPDFCVPCCKYTSSMSSVYAPCGMFKIGDVPLDALIANSAVLKEINERRMHKDSIKTNLMVHIDSMLQKY